MVVWVEVGDRSDEGLLVGKFRVMMVAFGRLVGHVVDAVGFVQLAVGVDHRGTSSSTGEAFFLAMSLFVAIPANNVGVAGVAGVACLAVVAGRAAVVFWWESAIARPKCGDLLDLLLGQFLTDDLMGFFWLKLGLDGGNFVKPLLIILNGLQVAGHFHALIEGVLFGHP